MTRAPNAKKITGDETRRSTESGSAILTSMMYTAFVMFIIISLLDFINLRSRERAATKLSGQRNQLMFWLRHEIRVGLNIYSSIGLPENAELKKCVVYDGPAGDPSGQCISTTNPASAPRGAHFITDKSISITGQDASHAVAYKADGTLCTAADVSANACAFTAWTEFTATCQEPGWWSCNTAKALLVSIHVNPILPTSTLAERVEIQYVSIIDWGFGQWSLVGYDSNVTVPATPTPNPDPTPVPSATPINADGDGTGTPSATPPPTMPAEPTPIPVPPPKASCGAGEMPIGNSCQRFSM